MTYEMIFLIVSFDVLLIWSLLERTRRKKLLRRTWGEWLLDSVGLAIHGLVVPLFQTYVIFKGLSFLFPQAAGSFDIIGPIAFLLAFVGVDYLYYWNHRLLHNIRFWRFHSVHHSSQSMDVFATSRNSAITTFLTLYIWVNGLLLFLLKDKEAFAAGVLLTNFLDILRHSGISAWPSFFPFNFITSPLIHGWHHSTDKYGINFGGNLNIWDRLHGTYYEESAPPSSFGYDIEGQSLISAFWTGYSK